MDSFIVSSSGDDREHGLPVVAGLRKQVLGRGELDAATCRDVDLTLAVEMINHGPGRGKGDLEGPEVLQGDFVSCIEVGFDAFDYRVHDYAGGDDRGVRVLRDFLNQIRFIDSCHC